MPDREPDTEAAAKKPTPPPPCRLYAILARRAPVGVIFRRGPSERVQIIHWDMVTDTFTPGQWFHGRIYERRSDISPNGRLLVYAARKENARTHEDKEYTSYWTAISKPPYLTALALWPCRSAVGGGLFLSDAKVVLNHRRAEPHPKHQPKGLKIAIGEEVLEESLLNRRLEHDGWRHVQEWRGEFVRGSWDTAYRKDKKAGLLKGVELAQSLSGLDTESGYVTHAPSIHEKLHPSQGLTLVMTTTISRFRHQHVYSVRDREGHEEKFMGVEWADWDQRGRLVFAQDGKMLALAADAIGKEPPQELVNLNGNQPEAVVAPDWAKTW